MVAVVEADGEDARRIGERRVELDLVEREISGRKCTDLAAGDDFKGIGETAW